MNKLPLGIAKKVLSFQDEPQQNASVVKGNLVTELIECGAFSKIMLGNKKAIIQCRDFAKVQHFLNNFYHISNLAEYIIALENDTNKAELVKAASNTKVKATRSMEGFLVNCFEPISVKINDVSTVIRPVMGMANFISDYKNLILSEEIIIVGVENPYCFLHISQQIQHFRNAQYLFVSRYPQSKDIINWLKNIPNRYLHYGDFDFAGINIYINEFKKHLGSRATFFVPDNIELLIKMHGNRILFTKQKLQKSAIEIDEYKVIELIALINKYGKGLEQEVLIN
jgi:hypothetical protein